MIKFALAILSLLSRLPAMVLYQSADVLAFVLQHIFRYRKKIVLENLINSFPKKNKQEIETIATSFYKNLSYRIAESILCISISKDELTKRMRVKNYELVDGLCAEGISVIAVLGHCGSWEMACLASSIYINPYRKYAIYTPSRNKDFDQAINQIRGRFGMQLISMQDTPHYLRHGFGNVSVGMFLADQSHSNPKRAYWTKFLNQDTAFMTGPARFAKAHQSAMIFVKVTSVGKGYYEIENVLISRDTTSESETELTEKFVRLLEDQIQNNPSDWLWSHRRWKHKRQ